MNIVADDSLGAIERYLGSHFNLTRLASKDITAKTVKNADVLLIRSTTTVDANLLEGSSVKLVACPAAGVCHIDLDYLSEQQIQLAHAPGCNAIAVAEYVLASIAFCQQQQRLPKEHLTVGLIGVGAVGQAVASLLEALNISLVLYDPPRALRDNNFSSDDISQLAKADLISLHIPLTLSGKYATHHLLNSTWLTRLKKDCLILNAARGAVVDPTFIKASGQRWCLDVFCQEPNIDSELFAHCLLATPHIAGQTQLSRHRGMTTVAKAIHKFAKTVAPKVELHTQQQLLRDHYQSWQSVVLDVFNLEKLSQQLSCNDATSLGERFTRLRKQAADRLEFSQYTIANSLPAALGQQLEKLGFSRR